MLLTHNVLSTCKQSLHTVLQRFATLIPFKFLKIKLIFFINISINIFQEPISILQDKSYKYWEGQ